MAEDSSAKQRRFGMDHISSGWQSGFIALALKGKGKGGNRCDEYGALIVATYLVQALVGFALTLLLVYTVFS